ncbi:hypothetical protein RRG08_027735 [Elysia crispata]|uniref:Uncharacterized protein n=1 Tax=Elysia crispata TaxID=231223 RepID=A0AAE1CUV2_9GAST|nr:hypothetical protein RRG08_027735 [Elysia crispata]
MFALQASNAKACQKPMAPITEARIKQVPPFYVVDIDYAGPIYCRDASSQKFYVPLFTAPSELFMKYGPESSSWRFSVPRAPWWGGWWERMIKVMKISLERSIGLKCLERTRLETALIEVEACINSRPLTFVVDEFSLGHPLSPSHFLVGRGNHLQKRIHDLELHAHQVLDMPELRHGQVSTTRSGRQSTAPDDL